MYCSHLSVINVVVIVAGCLVVLLYVYEGLEAQLLGNVVRKERPELEEQKDSLVRNIADGKKKLQQLEDEILRYGS